ncbi:ATP-grasp domain-containing protein [Phenylobacterium ferrooxidans]|uniref:ATP-grasp domain-containing protein n=1 Tax=Phenylobacterium ferrooxidans TaxID=2982689 RepID=A0ABW6CJ24_9CAUL
MPGKVRIGLIVGNDTDRAIEFDQAVNVSLRGNNDADLVLKLAFDEDEFDWTRLHMTPSYFRKTKRWETSKVDVLWNMVSDADQHPGTLAVIEKFTDQCDLPLIDPAAAILQTRRHDVARRLAGIEHIHMPKTLLLRNPTLERVRRQAEAAGFRFPAIVRRTGTHNGQMLGVFQSPEEIEGVYGDRRNEYYLTEFVDFRSPDGGYRKTRFFFVGDEIVLRQHVVSETWNIHGRSGRGMADHPDRLAEAQTWVGGGFAGLPATARTALRAIGDQIGLDYFGLDASLDSEGRVLVFEANATMNFLPRAGHMRGRSAAALAPMVAAVRKLLLAKAAQRATKT